MMTRFNFLLLAAVIGCALSVVTSQHKARKLFTELESQQESARKLDQEWRELQLESQTLATSKRIEQKAAQSLGMHVPEPGKSIVVIVDDKSAEREAPKQ
jgi:cell division protein FtsL